MNGFPTRVLSATDGSPQAQAAVRMAAGLCSRLGAELHLVHVGWVPAVYHPEMRGYAHRGRTRARRRRAASWGKKSMATGRPARAWRGRT